MVGRRLPTLALFLALIAGLLRGVAATATLRQVPYCDGQGAATRLGFEYECPDRAVDSSVNDENNPADSCEAIQVRSDPRSRARHPTRVRPALPARAFPPPTRPGSRAECRRSNHVDSTRPTTPIDPDVPSLPRVLSPLSSRSASTRPRPARPTGSTTPRGSASTIRGPASKMPRSSHIPRFPTPRA